jgi:hypothetical protein
MSQAIEENKVIKVADAEWVHVDNMEEWEVVDGA